jgi:hypothetical protein
MRGKIDSAASWLFMVTLCALAVLHLFSAVPAAAQTGQNASLQCRVAWTVAVVKLLV